MKILLLHAYSADNAGDGLLVTEALDLIREAFPGAHVDVAAQHPDTFDEPGVRFLDAGVSRRGPGRDLLRVLRSLDDYDLLVGVGGGYLRSGTPREGLQTLVAHGPQLWAAGRSSTPSVYLPQSVGPFRHGAGALLRRGLRRVDSVLLRDDLSIAESGLANARRVPDMALLADRHLRAGEPTAGPVVLSVRTVHGRVPDDVVDLAGRLGAFDGYVQSRGAGNDDLSAVESIGPRRILTREELLAPEAPRRVVISVRLHGALMSINAGHRAIHLSYERKGFGAFQDLGLLAYVHNVNDFDAALVAEQASSLLTDPTAGAGYDDALASATAALRGRRDELVAALRDAAVD
ncbi:polysaccharide pyruvyl transferase family protein [Janibacter hoylei]|uniref:polysaccharide pyruvyl transferase family protein n=1 Tax=Janibacter hoylei TaxID=364298 RepID=UPI002490F66D|nr:polysaccharide pyruvyl transferase family protein [Janibacter hoylei]